MAVVWMALLGALAWIVPIGMQERAPTPDIHYVPTPPQVVDAMLELAHVTADDVIYDLGSGDGRIVIAAAQRHGARGVGIEIDPALIKTATERARKAGVADKVRFLQADLFKTDLSEATVVTLYLSGSINFRLQPKLRRELKAGARIVSHRFDMGDWRPDETRTVEGRQLFLWRIPSS
jgi:SAM-dependent methyltransferase